MEFSFEFLQRRACAFLADKCLAHGCEVGL
jgi:hypothetical protein